MDHLPFFENVSMSIKSPYLLVPRKRGTRTTSASYARERVGERYWSPRIDGKIAVVAQRATQTARMDILCWRGLRFLGGHNHPRIVFEARGIGPGTDTVLLKSP